MGRAFTWRGGLQPGVTQGTGIADSPLNSGRFA